MGDCQNYGPSLGPYYNTGPNLGDPKRDHNFDNPPGRFIMGIFRVTILAIAVIHVLTKST